MSAPVRKVQPDTKADIGSDIRSDIRSDQATQELWRLAETDRIAQLEHILARGADINARNGEGVTALMRAAFNGRLLMVRALIDRGADINATREDGFTPLGLAALFGHTEVVRVLVERGADLGKATPFGTSADMWATARSFSEIAQYLEQARTSTAEKGVPETAHHFGLVPTPSENESGDDDPIGEPAPTEQPTPADLDVTMEVSGVMVPDQSVAKHPQENLETGQKSEHPSGKPVVVRTLKDPPEIWDLVHETPRQFNARGAFVTRLTSSKTNLILLTLGLILIAGLSTFAVRSLRARNRGAAAQAREGRGPSQTFSSSQTSVAANAQLNTQSNTTSSAGAGIDNTPTQENNPQPTNFQATQATQATQAQPINSQLTDQQGAAAPVRGDLTNSVQPTGVGISNITKRTASRAVRGQNADKHVARGEVETAASPDTNARPQQSQTADLKKSDDKNSSNSSSTTKRSNTTSSSQSAAPPPTTSAPKAKVIQWP